MTIKCEVIRDLLPLYVDEVVSEESRALIEEHLEQCTDCRTYCQLLKEEPPQVSTAEYADEAASLKKIKRRINRNQILLALVIIGFAIGVYAFLNAMHLADYEGSLQENLSYELPAGYERADSEDDSDLTSLMSPTGDPYSNTIEYIRETDTTRERLIIYYIGLDGNHDFEWADPQRLDGSTEYNFVLNDWDNGHYNELICEIVHGQEAYEVRYQCQETDKDDYYSSCSEEQQQALLAFVRTFDYHRPANEDVGNIFKRLYLNYGIAGLALLGLTILIFVGFPVGVAIGGLLGSDGKADPAEPVVRSRDLLDSVNRDRERHGEPSIPSINNPSGTSTNNLARRDHSWSSVPDFFIKLFRRK